MMPDSQPAYVVLGGGRWANAIGGVLSSEKRHRQVIADTRRRPAEDDTAYAARLATLLRATNAQIAWLCLPPAPEIALVVQASIQAGLSVIVEKPWRGSPAQTQSLIALAQNAGLQLGVHYQYCFLERVEEWRAQFRNTTNLSFGGRFTVSRPDRLGIAAIENLGSHLLAIREYAVPRSSLQGISCAYDADDERRVWLETENGRRQSISFSDNKEPLIQRFLNAFEGASSEKKEFRCDLALALRVTGAIGTLKAADG
jgi:hypothetical protein